MLMITMKDHLHTFKYLIHHGYYQLQSNQKQESLPVPKIALLSPDNVYLFLLTIINDYCYYIFYFIFIFL